MSTVLRHTLSVWDRLALIESDIVTILGIVKPVQDVIQSVVEQEPPVVVPPVVEPVPPVVPVVPSKAERIAKLQAEIDLLNSEHDPTT